MNGGRVRDAHRPEPKCLPSTGELIDIERVTISLEGGRWKRAARHLAGGLPYFTSSSEARGREQSRFP
jgi:hypothetical protein